MAQRSPVVFWLLVAATLCVNALAISWAVVTTLNRAEELYFGLVCGQLSVLSCWAFFLDRLRLWRLGIPLVGAIAAAGLTGWLYSLEARRFGDFMDLATLYMSLWLTQVSLIFIGIWLLRLTIVIRDGDQGVPHRLRFGTKDLFVMMTLLALLLAILRYSELVREIWLELILWSGNNAAIALFSVTLQATRWHSLMRLAATAAIVLLFAVVLEVLNLGGEPAAINAIQAIVIFLWVESGQILQGRKYSKVRRRQRYVTNHITK
jgi:hypothetical protein